MTGVPGHCRGPTAWALQVGVGRWERTGRVAAAAQCSRCAVQPAASCCCGAHRDGGLARALVHERQLAKGATAVIGEHGRLRPRLGHAEGAALNEVEVVAHLPLPAGQGRAHAQCAGWGGGGGLELECRQGPGAACAPAGVTGHSTAQHSRQAGGARRRCSRDDHVPGRHAPLLQRIHHRLLLHFVQACTWRTDGM